MRPFSTVCCTLLAIAAIAVSALRATTLLPAEFREIVGNSQIIAYGRVADAVPELSDDRKRIETVVTFDVGTYLKGGPGETFDVSRARRTDRSLPQRHGRRAGLRER